ncbi:MAG: response regulator RpfG family c-di-GMP phosphodiesterase [Paraglaciecola sp.]|jgi:response regulator RpfG family c-di-GMP phosphodiesterase
MYDEIIFAEDNEEEISNDFRKWKVLIVDDEPEVHAVTKLALSDFIFLDKRLEFISAYSGEEAKQIFLSHSDIAVVLLDVVMETDDAGLRVADFVRNEAANNFTRIILRTGQPGQAPERDVIINYDINDYKSKTELTSQKLFTVVIAALRSYRDIMVIDENRRGLEKIISASANLFSIRSLEQFIEGIVQQLTSLLGYTQDALYLTSADVAPVNIEQKNPSQLYVFTGQGEYQNMEGLPLEQVVKGEKLISCQRALAEKGPVYEDEYLVAYCNSKSKRGSLLYLSGLPKKLSETDKRLVEIFSQNVQLAFENVLLSKDFEDTQQELIECISQAMESHFGEGKHIKRMVKICALLGREYGLNEEQIKTLNLAVPLYDIGKIKIPKEVAHKSGDVVQEGTEASKEHVEFGSNLLTNSQRPLIKAATLLARDHDENWDGLGYPRGLIGEDINIYGRISALADTYETLRSKRNGEDEWPVDKAIESIVSQKGQKFEPKLVEILQANIDTIEQILLNHPDPK